MMGGGKMMFRADFSNIQQKGEEMSSTKKVSFNWAELIPKIEAVPLASLNPYKNNPRRNAKSIPVVKQSVKRYGFLVPIVINNTTDFEIAAGHTRLAASLELCKDEGRDPKTVKVPCILAEHLTPEQIRQFRVVDNQAASLSNWDWGKLNEEFAAMPDVDWADFGFPAEKKETEKLSDVDGKSLYYEPQNVSFISLEDCISMEKYEAKVAALDEFKLTKAQKDLLAKFALRFIRIDFEAVANYYTFFASEEEKKAIERLRLVLTDNGKDGFIEDDMLRVLNIGREREGRERK